MLVNRSVCTELVCKRIRDADCVVFDECSMGSARLLELFHSITATARSNQPFGGLQAIAVGDFPQLKPVHDKFDDGAMFYSSIFAKLFPHVIELTVIHRQEETEERFQCVVRELRRG